MFSEAVPIIDASSVGEVRRKGMLAAERLGLDEVKAGELALLATEVSRNVLLHGGGGEAIILGTKGDHGPTAGVLALDKGCGIQNVANALADGYSTAGTMGGGLGAMKRIANSLDIFTAGNGTIVFLELGKPAKNDPLQIAGITVPFPKEKFCGDAWAYHHTPERTLIFLVDGLGHGLEASEAAQEAVSVFHRHSHRNLREILSYMHDALKKTRGAAAAISEVRPSENRLIFAGVGNISAVVLSNKVSRSLASHNGTLGIAAPRIQEFSGEWPSRAVLIMHSDGVQTRWDLSSYPGLLSRHPAVIGGALLRDFRRQRDDASVVVVKCDS